MKTKVEIIKEEIEAKKRELEQLELEEKTEVRRAAIKDLSEYTDYEKCKYFDETYSNALIVLKLAEEDGQEDDNEREAWERQLNILARDNDPFWTYYENLFD